MAKAEADTQAVDTSGQVDATDTEVNQDDRTLGDDWDEGTDFTDSDSDDLESDDDSDSAATEDDEADDSEDDTDVDESTDEADDESAEDEDSDSKDESDTTDDESDRKLTNEEAARLRIENKKAREDAAKAQAEAERHRREREEEKLQAFLDAAGDDEQERNNREIAIKEHRLQEREIVMNRQTLQVGIERAVASIDLFRTGSDVQKEELANTLDDFEARFVEKDEQGRPSAIKIDPRTGQPADVVSYLQTKAESIRKLAGEGVKTQAKQKSKQKARTQVTPVRAPKKAKSDALLDGFDEEANRW